MLRRKSMRTARNIFIFNLSLSDFFFTVSIPFTLMDALTWAWPLPSSTLACRFVVWLIGCLVTWLVIWLFSWLVGWLVGCLVGLLAGYMVVV